MRHSCPNGVKNEIYESGSSKKYKVWAEKESQRFELQTLFLTFEEGQEKRVLLRELCSS